MDNNVIKALSESLNIKVNQIECVLKLLSEGATIPFIARYRKELTGNLDEDQIRSIEEQYRYQNNLFERKNDVIRLIDEKDLLTEELKQSIINCKKLTEVEDLYRPFKEKKKTKATEAIKLGLEPLAKKIMSFPTTGNMENLCSGYNMDYKVALENAGYIISEWISDNVYYRKIIRSYLYREGKITSKIKKGAEDSLKTFSNYYDFCEHIKTIKHFRVLALNRGENLKVLNVGIDYDLATIENMLADKIIKNKTSFVVPFILEFIKDSLKRLILPSIEREIRSELTEDSELQAIDTFKINLEHLLMTRPIKGSNVLGFDPAFRTGCKLAVLDKEGRIKKIAVIYPHEPVNDKLNSAKTLLELINEYHIDLIAIGNGTASRESESFVAETIKNTNCKYIIVSEAGASVYSASKEAQNEFPDLTVEKRSAISIGRRIQDPLAELVKIDPKSIGVGEYQHDVNQKTLGESLDFTVLKIVNSVGVNVNTASEAILKYVSGLNKSSIKAILDNVPFTSREEIKKLKGVSAKTFEQCAGFLKIVDGINPLDNTKIHPESYELTNKLLKALAQNINDINSDEFKETLKIVNPESLADELNSDVYTISDIINELLAPGLDPRDNLEQPTLKSDILHIEDLKIGMELEGTVRNVASFGAFIDIGLKNDGLCHISKLSNSFVSNPLDIVNVGDIVKCYVIDIDIETKKVGLSLVER